MFLGFENGHWLKILFNDETLTWELNKSNETPDEEHPLGDEEYYYPYKQYMPKNWTTVGTITKHQLVTNTELIIYFSRGVYIKLNYTSEHEKAVIKVQLI